MPKYKHLYIIGLWRYADTEFENMNVQTLDINMKGTVKLLHYNSGKFVRHNYKGRHSFKYDMENIHESSKYIMEFFLLE